MQRINTWALSLVIFSSVGTFATVRSAVAQFLDPGPTVDATYAEPEYESELPAPPQSFEREEPARDFSQAYLGVSFDPQYPSAAVARSVTAGSPADQAGIKAGDTIVSVNGRRVASYDDVLNWVDRLKPGDVLDIDVSRRVSVKARAILDGQPVGERTSNYRPTSEPLPMPEPAQIQTRPRSLLVPSGASTARPRPNYAPQPNRPSNVNRNDDDSDRDRGFRNRGRAPRRRG